LKSTRWQKRYLYIAVFTSGMTTLAIELSASRLLGNIFGTSNLVWANVIGLMLIYLTLGYFIGGRWADRSPHYTTFYRIIIWGAFLSGIVPLIARPVLRYAAEAVYELEAGVALGSFISILVLFSIPITLLGCVSPFAIRLAIKDEREAGKVSGTLYAVSTLGSILGTFAPVLLLIPELGTSRTFLFFSGVLLLIGFIGLWISTGRLSWRMLWMPPTLIALAVIALQGPQRPPPPNMELLYERDSAYNLIQIVEDKEGYRYLLLNEGQGYHSQWHPTEIYYARTWDYFLVAPYFNPDFTPDQIGRIAIVGLAGGTIARQHTAVYGDIPIDGIEIDEAIIEASREYLGMDMPNLNAIVGDGRYEFNRLDHRYLMVGIDAYRVPYVPWHLTTVEFFEEIRDKLTDNGVVVINVGRTRTDRRLVDAMTNTMLEVYPSVYAMDVPDSLNTILVATKQPTQESNLRQNLIDLQQDNVHSALLQSVQVATETLVPLTPSEVVFRDDRAPVETIVDSMVIDYLLEGESY
jgi:spermidine synthase